MFVAEKKKNALIFYNTELKYHTGGFARALRQTRDDVGQRKFYRDESTEGVCVYACGEGRCSFLAEMVELYACRENRQHNMTRH